jgi:tetratricopeptide (TPR) repeat protein
LGKNYTRAKVSLREALDLQRAVEKDSDGEAILLNDMGDVELAAGNHDDAERYYRETFAIAQKLKDDDGQAVHYGSLVQVALDRSTWSDAETLGKESLRLAERLGKLEIIANASRRLAHALVRQGRYLEALPLATRAVSIHSELREPDELAKSELVLLDCQEGVPKVVS